MDMWVALRIGNYIIVPIAPEEIVNTMLLSMLQDKRKMLEDTMIRAVGYYARRDHSLNLS